MNKKPLVLVIYILLVAVLAVSVWLISLLVIPVNPKNPYQPDRMHKLTGVNWLTGEFQPIYLYAFNKGSQNYIKVIYRNKKKQISIIDLYVGDTEKGNRLLSGIEYTDKYIKITNKSEYKNYLTFGKRFRANYLYNVTNRSELPDIYTEALTSPSANKLCKIIPQMCTSGEIIKTNPDIYWNFKQTGIIPQNAIFPIISINTSLEI